MSDCLRHTPTYPDGLLGVIGFEGVLLFDLERHKEVWSRIRIGFVGTTCLHVAGHFLKPCSTLLSKSAKFNIAENYENRKSFLSLKPCEFRERFPKKKQKLFSINY